MKAEWSESTDKHVCLCCGQNVLQPGKPIPPEKAEAFLSLFEALGFTREDLLGKHRAQIDYQTPGFAEWLQGQ